VRVGWGGRTDGAGIVTWWSVLGATLLGVLLLLVARRRHVVRRAAAPGAATP
jgi:hypothetical protein